MEMCLHVVGKAEAERLPDEEGNPVYQYAFSCQVYMNEGDPGSQVFQFVVDKDLFERITTGDDMIFQLKE